VWVFDGDLLAQTVHGRVGVRELVPTHIPWSGARRLVVWIRAEYVSDVRAECLDLSLIGPNDGLDTPVPAITGRPAAVDVL
jgi:hypothetical protein